MKKEGDKQNVTMMLGSHQLLQARNFKGGIAAVAKAYGRRTKVRQRKVYNDRVGIVNGNSECALPTVAV